MMLMVFWFVKMVLLHSLSRAAFPPSYPGLYFALIRCIPHEHLKDFSQHRLLQ